MDKSIEKDNETHLKISFILQVSLEMRGFEQLQNLTEFLSFKNYFPSITAPETLLEISKHLYLETVQKDEYVLRKGELADKIYIIFSGGVSGYDTPASELFFNQQQTAFSTAKGSNVRASHFGRKATRKLFCPGNRKL